MNKLSYVIKVLTHGNVDENFYKENIKQLRTHNVIMIKLGFSFATIITTIILLFASTTEILAEVKTFYIIFTSWFIFWEILTFTVLSKHHEYARFFYGVFSFTVLFMTALAGTLYSKEMYAVTFFIFLIFIPGLYVNRPNYCITTIVLSAIIFCLMSIYFKTDSYIITVDIINTSFAVFVSIIFNLYSVTMQLQNIQSSTNLKRLSVTDDLTKLPNRRSFNNRIDSYFTKNYRDVVLFMIDVDFFKKYNDTYGHLKGDECLSRIGYSLNKIAKQYNIFVARYGGEEFVAVGTTSDIVVIKEIAKEFLKSVEEQCIVNERSIYQYVTLSLGYASYVESNAKDYMQLINFADEALYQAKRNGRNQAISYKRKF